MEIKEYPDVQCVYCKGFGIRIETRLEAKPIGTYSIAGAQDKVVAQEWPYAVCLSCGHESRGKWA